MENENIYQENGFKDREEYLIDLAGNYNVSTQAVFALADMLGENEDFDGLICALEDAEGMDL